MRLPALAAALAALLSACAPQPMVGALGGPAVEFRCPKPGTRAAFSSGRPVVYTGADPADALICLGTNPDGTPFRRVANHFTVTPGTEASIRAGLAPLFPLAPGKTVDFGYIQGYSNDPTKTGQYQEKWTVIGPDTAKVGETDTPTILVTRQVTNHAQYGMIAYRWKLWLDPATGIWVKGEPEFLQGQGSNQVPFQARRIILPAT